MHAQVLGLTYIRSLIPNANQVFGLLEITSTFKVMHVVTQVLDKFVMVGSGQSNSVADPRGRFEVGPHSLKL